MVHSSGLETFSAVLGWVYFSCWSISFYPQVYLNWKRKSVVGYSFDYVAYNISGYLFYSIYTVTNFVQQRRLGLTEAVEPNDVAFALHGVLLMIILIGQCLIYEREEQRVHPAHGVAVACMWLGAILNCFLAFAAVIPWYTHNPIGASSKDTPPYSVLEYCGYCKVFVSFIKNCPQAYLNYKAKSTAGWSTVNVNLDITGGLLSFAQQAINAYNSDDWSVMTGNISKFMLALESVAFDCLYLIQRFCLYPPASDDIDHHLLDSPSAIHHGSGAAVAVHRSDDDRLPLHIAGGAQHHNNHHNSNNHRNQHDRINDVF